MKIVCLSDTHNDHNYVSIQPCDVLIFCGDGNFTNTISIERFNSWLSKQPARFKIVVVGNHDRIFEKEPSLSKRILNAVYLQDEGTEIGGVHFWGSPWTPTFFNWSFMEDRGAKIKRHWDMIPSNTDVLITHGPPMGILDISSYGNEHCGCQDLMDAVNRVNPKFHLFGHIHNSYGIHKTDKTTFINCSVLNDNYNLVNKPVEFDI